MDGLSEQLIGHEVGTGACCQESAVADQLHGTQIDFPVALRGIFHRVPGLGKCRRIQDNHVKLFPFCFQLRKQVKDIRAEELHPLLHAVQSGIQPRLLYAKL